MGVCHSPACIRGQEKDVSAFSREDLQWMGQALELARQAELEGEVPVGAVVVCDNHVVGEGWNRNIGLHDPTAHAEIMAMREAGKSLGNYRLPACTLYVSLEPCMMCAGAMIHARIARLVFAANDPKTGAAGGQFDLLMNGAHNHLLQVRGGVFAQESSDMLKQFFKDRRK